MMPTSTGGMMGGATSTMKGGSSATSTPPVQVNAGAVNGAGVMAVLAGAVAFFL